MEFDEKFKNYCKQIALEYDIQITNKIEWYVSIKNKGWNQYKEIYKLYKKYHADKQSIQSNYLIDLYKINIRLRNVLYQYSLFIEEYVKSWLYYHNYDENNKINNMTINQLIKKIKTNVKQDIIREINGHDFKLETVINNYYQSWNKIRNLSCHRNLKIILANKDLKIDVKNMMFFLNNHMKYSDESLRIKDNFIQAFNKALRIKNASRNIKKIIRNFEINKG